MAKKKSAKSSRSISTSSGRAFPPFQLADLYLREAAVSRPGIRVGAPPPSQIKIGIQMQVGQTDDKPSKIVVELGMKATATYDGNDSDPAILISATFVLVYRLKEAIPDMSDEQLVAFGQHQGMLNAWPYWREFVQSATSRMGLPPLKMPLIVPAGLEPENVEHVD